MKSDENGRSSNLEERVRELVEEVIADRDLFLVDLELRGRHGSRVIDVYIESDIGVDLESLAKVSRELHFLLDTEDLIAGSYHLNVSSPGVDRPLAVPRQYKKNIGRPLQVHFRKEDGTGQSEVTGELKQADEEAVEIEVSKKEVRRIRIADIVWAKVRLPW